jgi:hypothetical protein
LEFRVNDDQARRDRKFSAWKTNVSVEAVKDLRDTDEYKAVAGPAFGVVRFTQGLLLVRILSGIPATELPQLKSRLRRARQRYGDAIKELQDIKQSFQDDPEVALLMDYAAEELAKKQDRIPVDADSIAPPGGGTGTSTSVAFREISNRIPETYAALGTPDHQRTIEAIATALGVPFTRSTYRDIFKRW